MIIDAHTHINRIPGRDPENSTYKDAINELLGQMKTAKIDHAFVIAGISEKTNPSQKELLDLVKYEKRISVIGAFDIQKEQSVETLTQFLKEKKIIGIKIYTGYQHIFPNDQRLIPVYELCLNMDVPVIFHSGDTFSIREKAKVKYAHPLHIDEVAADFPNLKIIIAHMGNPWLIDCAEVLYKNKNVYADCSGLVEYSVLKTKSPYGVMLKQRIKELITYVGTPRKLLYGTDYPLTAMKPYLQFIRSIGIGKNDLEYVMWKNAATLFRLNV